MAKAKTATAKTVTKRAGKKAAVATKEVAEEEVTNVVEAVDEEAVVCVNEELTTLERIAKLHDAMTRINKAFRRSMTELRNIEKAYQKELRTTRNGTKRVKRRQANPDGTPRPPSGFAKPTKISDELCRFLGVPAGTEMSRTDVTRRINAYIKENELQNTENRRQINPDAKLRKLLGAPQYPLNRKDESQGKGYSYFNLQRYMSRHFPKAAAKVAAAKTA